MMRTWLIFRSKTHLFSNISNSSFHWNRLVEDSRLNRCQGRAGPHQTSPVELLRSKPQSNRWRSSSPCCRRIERWSIGKNNYLRSRQSRFVPQRTRHMVRSNHSRQRSLELKSTSSRRWYFWPTSWAWGWLKCSKRFVIVEFLSI